MIRRFTIHVEMRRCTYAEIVRLTAYLVALWRLACSVARELLIPASTGFEERPVHRSEHVVALQLSVARRESCEVEISLILYKRVVPAAAVGRQRGRTVEAADNVLVYHERADVKEFALQRPVQDICVLLVEECDKFRAIVTTIAFRGEDEPGRRDET